MREDSWKYLNILVVPLGGISQNSLRKETLFKNQLFAVSLVQEKISKKLLSRMYNDDGE